MIGSFTVLKRMGYTGYCGEGCPERQIISTEVDNFYVCPRNRHLFDTSFCGTPGWYPGRG